MRRQLAPALGLLLVLSALLGLAYPVVVWGIGQTAFHSKVNGSLVSRDGHVVASSLLGQNFLDSKGDPVPGYFQPRPSSAGAGYDSTASAASNLGPGDPRLIATCLPVQATAKDGTPKVDAKGNPVYEKNPDGSKVCSPNTIPHRAKAYRKLNGLSAKAVIPADAVTGSFSGLDPSISIANARLQTARVARARGLSVAQVTRIVNDNTSGRVLGSLGEDAVNVVKVNLALDDLHTS